MMSKLSLTGFLTSVLRASVSISYEIFKDHTWSALALAGSNISIP